MDHPKQQGAAMHSAAFLFCVHGCCLLRERLPIFHAIIQLLAQGLYLLGNFHGGRIIGGHIRF